MTTHSRPQGPFRKLVVLGNVLIANRIFEVIVRACPGLADSVNRRDADTDWSRLIRPLLSAGPEPSATSRPGH